MQLLPMDLPAELRRAVDEEDSVLVASGPLAIMAGGLMALAPADRKLCWIQSAAGNLSADDAEAALRVWHAPVKLPAAR